MKTTLTLDLAGILKRKYPRGFHVPADIGIDMLLEYGEEDWEHDLDIDLRALLAERRAIALVWDAGMVRDAYPHLTPEQAWEALRECERDHEAGRRLGWAGIAEVLDRLFPSAQEARRRLLEGLRRLQGRVEALPAGAGADPSPYGELAAALDALEDTLRTKGG